MTSGAAAPFSARTAWSRSVRTPLREFLSTETGGAAVLLAAAVAALVWVNLDSSSYTRLWETTLSINLGDWGVSLSLRDWVNSGLMTFFFFVVGLEARREIDLGELRERRRFLLPFVAGLGGMAVAVTIYLAFNAGSPSAAGWGIAMSTDTAFALGLLALVGPRFPDRLRAFMLTVVVVDDLVALAVIVLVYSGDLEPSALVVAFALFGLVLGIRALRIHRGALYLVPERRSGWPCSSPASSQSSLASRWVCSRTRPLRSARRSSVRVKRSASSGSSRRPSWPALRASR